MHPSSRIRPGPWAGNRRHEEYQQEGPETVEIYRALLVLVIGQYYWVCFGGCGCVN